jgi:hypothetical protein
MQREFTLYVSTSGCAVMFVEGIAVAAKHRGDI